MAEKEFVVLIELLMVQLLKLDTIEADGEAKVQRRIEVSEKWISLRILYLSFLSTHKNLEHLKRNSYDMTFVVVLCARG